MESAQTVTTSKCDRPRLALRQHLWQRLGRLCLAVINMYVVLLTFYLPLRVLLGDRLWPVALVNTFAHWVLFPTLVLLPIMLWLRRWTTAAVLGVGVVVFLWLFGGLFLPQLPAAVSSSHLTVMTYNVAHTFVDADDLVAALRSSGADIIALQELTDEHATAIERDLRDLYPYQSLYGYGIPGKGLLSHYPILEEELFYLQAQRLPHLRATIAVDDAWPGSSLQTTPITVIVAHPPPPGLGLGGYRVHPYAAAEIASLAQMTTASGPGILMGDFNLADQNDNYALLSDAGLTDAFRVAGWGFGVTWPARRIGPLRLLVRVDYVWYSDHFHAIESWVGPHAGSDHLPVLARLAWRVEAQD